MGTLRGVQKVFLDDSTTPETLNPFYSGVPVCFYLKILLFSIFVDAALGRKNNVSLKGERRHLLALLKLGQIQQRQNFEFYLIFLYKSFN